MEYTLETSLKEYFPNFKVISRRINNMIYIEVSNFVEYTISILPNMQGCMSINEMILKEDVIDRFYDDIRLGLEMDGMYAMHAIVCSIIRCREKYQVWAIMSDDGHFKKYFSTTYKKFKHNGIVVIETLLNHESDNFIFLDFCTSNGCRPKALYNLETYPIGMILNNYETFGLFGAVMGPLNYTLQNPRVMLKAYSNISFDSHRVLMLQIMTSGNLSKHTTIGVINKYFNADINIEILEKVPLFKSFDSRLIEMYDVVGKGYYQQISKMSGIPAHFIDEHYEGLKPYIVNILKDQYCPLPILIKHKKELKKFNLWQDVLMHNKFITREFLVKHCKRYPNALINRMEILERGDERLFKRYRRVLNWDDLTRASHSTTMDLHLIMYYSQKYTTPEQRGNMLINMRTK